MTLDQIITLGKNSLENADKSFGEWRADLEWIVRELEEIRDRRLKRFTPGLEQHLANTPLPYAEEPFFIALSKFTGTLPIRYGKKSVFSLEQVIAQGETSLHDPRNQAAEWRAEAEWMLRELKEIRDGKRDRFSSELSYRLADTPLPWKDEPFFAAYVDWSNGQPVHLQR